MSSDAIRTRSFSLLVFLLAMVLFTTFAGAQNFRGGINGVVTDQGGAAIPGAQVQITEDATGVIHTSVSSSAGDYSFPDLPLGLYTVSATSSGFETLKVEKVQVSAGTTYSLPIKLAVASQATTVEVNAAGVAIDTTSTVADHGYSHHYDSGHPDEWAGFHPVHAADARLCRLFRRWGGRYRFGERDAIELSELANRRH